jgi:hypothetical protein
MTEPSLDAHDVRAVPPGIPRWLKVSALVVAALIVLVIAVMLLAGGNHGPGRHLSLALINTLSATERAAASWEWAG